MKRIIILLFCIVSFISNNLFAQTTKVDSTALVKIYSKTGGASWTNKTNWLTSKLSSWYGVELSSIDKRVFHLDLKGNNLSDTLPKSIGKLTGLDWLDLRNNAMVGKLPDSLTFLKNLRYLNLRGNKFSDSLPDQFGNLSSLTYLYLDDNEFKGDLPYLKNLKALQNITVSGNKFTFANLEASGFIDGDIDIFTYSPQDTVLGLFINQNEGLIGIKIEDDELNSYTWYKEGVLQKMDTRIIVPFGKGKYNCLVTNSKFPNLTLYSDTVEFNYKTVNDSIALVKIFRQTNGANWKNKTKWLTDKLNNWAGVKLDSERRVSELILRNNSLKGALPLELSNLTHLRTLDLDTNLIKGFIPDLSKIDSLESISIRKNKFMFGDISNSKIKPKPGGKIDFIYSPQDTFPVLKYGEYELSITVEDVNDTNNVYTWYDEDVLIKDTTRIKILNSEGLFNCTVTNSVYAGLELATDTFDFAFSVATDSIALVHLYNETGGSSWTNKSNWLSGRISTWYGISVNAKNGRVSKISLPKNNLKGAIPNELGNLTHLDYLDLNNNQLSGKIPVEFVNLDSLTNLRLFHNQLSGNIPDSIGNLLLLTELRLESNKLNDSIPESIYNLTKLEDLNLSSNSLIGEISKEIDNLTKLEWLSFSNNNLDGTIPVEIGSLSQLNGIELNDNQFTGTIPDTIFSLNGLTWLSLGNNNFSGTIPVKLGELEHLNFLSLGGNQFSGKIPNEISILTELTELFLNDNILTDTIPSAIGNLASLNTIDLSGNRLSGSIPEEFANLTGLVNIYLDSNLFIGDLPDLSKFQYLSKLSVENNKFTFSSLSSTGIVSSDINEFTYSPQDTVFCLKDTLEEGLLTVIDDREASNTYKWYKDNKLLEDNDTTILLTSEGEYYCKVSNTLYPDLTIMSDTFKFSYELFTDSIALVHLYKETGGSLWKNKTNWTIGRLNTWYGVTIGSDDRVNKVILNSNNLTDTLPVELGALTHLRELNLQSNNLSGSIPKEIGDIDSLRVLMLNNNQFSGVIPAGIDSLVKLNTLYLDNNSLTRTIPSSLGKLVNLTRLTLHSNNFEGAIPGILGGCTKLINLNLSKNKLSGTIPESFGNLKSLQNLYLSNNRLAGNIPSYINQMESLRVLNLSDNLFTGQIPEGLGNIENLTTLYLSGNDLSGLIPEDLGYLGSFQYFNISDNNYEFSDLEPLWRWTNFNVFKNDFQYSPQPKIGLTSLKTANISSPFILRIEGYQPGENDKFQWFRNNELLEGETDSLLFIPSFSLIDTGTYFFNVTNTLATLLTLTSENIRVIDGALSGNISLSNFAINDNQDECFGALQTITVAGGGSTVALNSGSSVNFIAGQSIRFLPGFHAKNGSYMDAHITQDATFCDIEDKSIILAEYQQYIDRKNSAESREVNGSEINFKVFPNPSDGRFTIELSEEGSDSEVLIYNITGSEIAKFKTGDRLSLQVEIEGIEKGIYFIKVTNRGGEQLSRKILIK